GGGAGGRGEGRGGARNALPGASGRATRIASPCLSPTTPGRGMSMERTFRRRPIEIALPPYGVFVLESRHAPGFRMASQRHDFLEIFYVLEGAGAIHVEGRPHACRKGDVVAVPAGAAPRLEDDPAPPPAPYGIRRAPAVLPGD